MWALGRGTFPCACVCFNVKSSTFQTTETASKTAGLRDTLWPAGPGAAGVDALGKIRRGESRRPLPRGRDGEAQGQEHCSTAELSGLIREQPWGGQDSQPAGKRPRRGEGVWLQRQAGSGDKGQVSVGRTRSPTPSQGSSPENRRWGAGHVHGTLDGPLCAQAIFCGAQGPQRCPRWGRGVPLPAAPASPSTNSRRWDRGSQCQEQDSVEGESRPT